MSRIILLVMLISTVTFCADAPKDSTPELVSMNFRVQDEDGKDVFAQIKFTTSRKNHKKSKVVTLWRKGLFSVELPVGSANISVSSGPFYKTLHRTVSVQKGMAVTHNLSIDKVLNVGSTGWNLIDPFAHAYGGAHTFKDLKEAETVARAKGLSAVCYGGLPRINSSGTSVKIDASLIKELDAINESGEFAMLSGWVAARKNAGCFFAIEPKLPPKYSYLLSDGALHNSFLAVKARGGMSVLAQPSGTLGGGSDGRIRWLASEMIFNTVAGPLYDAVDVSRGHEDLAIWMMLLNNGYRIPAVGGGPTVMPSNDTPAVGMAVRSYKKRLEAKDVILALKEGRSVVTNGPFLNLQIDNAYPGDVIRPSEKWRSVLVTGISTKEMGVGIKRIELLYNGKVLYAWHANDKERRLKAKRNIGVTDVSARWNGTSVKKMFEGRLAAKLRNTGWFAARYVSTDKNFAITNPVYIAGPRNTPPRPVSSKVTLKLHDAKSGKAISGIVYVYAGRVLLMRGVVKATGVTFNAPASAQIVVEAGGYRRTEVSIYADGGPLKMINELAKKKRLRAALLDWKSYEKMRKIISDVNFDIPMKPFQRK